MVAVKLPSFIPDSFADAIVPHNIDSEQNVLGSCLLNPELIHKAKDELLAESFYSPVHQEVFKAMLTLVKKGETIAPRSVEQYLKERKKLKDVGALSVLMRLIDAATLLYSNFELDISIVKDKYLKRRLINLSNEVSNLSCNKFGSEDTYNASEIVEILSQRIIDLKEEVKLELEDKDALKYSKLVQAISEIELNIADPGLKFVKMLSLSERSGYGKNVALLETIYFKSLVAEQNRPSMSFTEFKEIYGKEVREWLMGGFLPKGKVVLLYAEGGTGKTRLAYDMGLHLLTGQPWSHHPTNGKYNCLYVQTDEAASDMIGALEARGYEDDLPLRIKSSWTMDFVPQLLKEIQEHQISFVLIDSLTSTNVGSLYSENEVAYSRPILKLKEVAEKTGACIVLIHHASKSGESRGSSAIKASVSEVWKLSKDASEGALPTDRLLKIEKTRSRAPGTYRLSFVPEDKSWVCIGKDDEEIMSATVSMKDKVVAFLDKHRGVPYQCEELKEELGGLTDTVRKACYELGEDGVIYRKEIAPKRGRPQKYYLPLFQNPDSPITETVTSVVTETFPLTTGISEVSVIGINQLPRNGITETIPSTTGVPEVSGKQSSKNGENNFEKKSSEIQNPGNQITETPENLANKGKVSVIHPITETEVSGNPGNQITETGEKLPPVRLLSFSPIGKIKYSAQHLGGDKWELKLELPDGSTASWDVCDCGQEEKKIKRKLQKYFDKWLESLRFTVYDSTEKTFWVEGCRCSKIPNYALGEKDVEFTTPNGKKIFEGRKDYYKLEKSS